MKNWVYISSDIEGCAWASNYIECDENSDVYQVFRTVMSVELSTIIDSCISPANILLRDAHGNARNILKKLLPGNVKLIRGWDNDPTNMMKGINSRKFDFACLHGYHAAAGTGLSPLAHTFSSKNLGTFTLNGHVVGETIFSIYTAAYFGVPVIYICGDYGAVTEAKSINPNIVGTVTKKFKSQGRFMLSATDVLEKIKTDFTMAQDDFYKNPRKFNVKLPKKFILTIQYLDKEQTDLHLTKMKNVKKVAADTLKYETCDFYDLLKTMRKLKVLIRK